MAGEVCEQHPDVLALYACDGCGKNLCNDCITEGHALLFCNVCGERALPLAAETPATTHEKRRREVVTKPYSLRQALGYPFRGSGLYLYIATILTMAFLSLVRSFWLSGMFSFLLASMQLKIVETSANGDDELPDWPEYYDFTERFKDWVTGIFAYFYQFIGIGVLFWAMAGPLGPLQVFSSKPRLTFWLEAAFCLWVGTALAVMALGAAGAFGRPKVFTVHGHIKGFLHAGGDAVQVTNVVFALGGALLIARMLLAAASPFLGAALAGMLGAYWFFVHAHLAGVLFRRHLFELEGIYD